MQFEIRISEEIAIKAKKALNAMLKPGKERNGKRYRKMAQRRR